MDDTAILAEAALRLAPAGAPESAWRAGIQSALRALMRRIATEKGFPQTCFADASRDAEALLDKIGSGAGWGAAHIGDLYQTLLELNPRPEDGVLTVTRGRNNARAGQGAWYTPEPVAMFMARISIDTQVERFADDPDPHAMLNILAIDPACGAGAFLVEACRHIAARYAARLFGSDDPGLAATAQSIVMYECVYGIDIDPVAVDLARFACWAELGGAVPFGFLDRNIICGDVLSGPDVEPPHLTERLSRARGASDA